MDELTTPAGKRTKRALMRSGESRKKPHPTSPQGEKKGRYIVAQAEIGSAKEKGRYIVVQAEIGSTKEKNRR